MNKVQVYGSRTNKIGRKFPQGNTYFRFLFIVIIVLSILILLNSVVRFFSHDEFEHIHSAWYVENGDTPYSDFFQNHHPLLWFILAPVLSVLGYSLTTILVLRILMALFFFGIVWLVYRITRYISGSMEISLISVVFLLSMVMFVEKGIEIRPDVPQVFFGLLSVFYFLKFFKEKYTKFVILSGISGAVSFLFLQKAVFMLMFFGLFLVYLKIKKEINTGSVLAFVLSFTVPVLIFFGYLLLSRSLSDYLITNWIFHVRHVLSFFPFSLLAQTLAQNVVFWILFVLAVRLFLIRKRINYELTLVTLLGLFLFLSTFLVKHPYRQYFMLPVSLICISNGYFMKFLFFKYRCNKGRKITVLILILIIPLVFLVTMVSHTNSFQRARIQFVLQNSNEADYVYDGDSQFNLFRKDVHYFWYSIVNKGLATYNRITGDRYSDYDICRLIKQKKPKIISIRGLEACDLVGVYEKTEFKDLHIRVGVK